MKSYDPVKTSFIEQIVLNHLREAITRTDGFDIKPRAYEPLSDRVRGDVHLRSLRW